MKGPESPEAIERRRRLAAIEQLRNPQSLGLKPLQVEDRRKNRLLRLRKPT